MKTQKIYSRPRVDKLLAGVANHPLTCIVAGAGYGKTTAVAEFLKKANLPTAYVTLTSGDAEVLWNKLCAAVELQNHDAADALRLLGLPVGPWAVARAVKLAREQCHAPFVICIDDYQHLPQTSPVHTLVETLAFENVQNLHILLLSRTQPPIRLATLASRGMALCVGAEDLCFDTKETGEYLAMRGLRLTSAAVESIRENAGGWISAIYLLGEGVRGGSAIRRGTIDMLFEENLMQALPEEDRGILYRLSVFESFPIDMAVYALGMERARALIHQLLRENAFITRDSTGLFRFHPLFREYLAIHCPNDDAQKEIYHRAGLWYVNQPDSRYLYSVELFEKSGTVEEFLALHNKPSAKPLNYHDIDALCHMAESLPDAFCIKYPFPYLQIGFYLLLSGQKRYVQLARRLLDLMREHFAASDTSYRNVILGELLIISRATNFDRLDSEQEPLEEAARLLDGKRSIILRANNPFTFGLPMLLYSAYMRAGTLDETVKRCRNNPYELVTDGFGRGSECLVQAEAALLRCDMDEVGHMAEQAATEAKEKNQYAVMASAYFVLMRRALALGDTEGAILQLDRIRALMASAIATLDGDRVTATMLRETLLYTESFCNDALGMTDQIPVSLRNGSYKSLILDGLGTPQVFAAKIMLTSGNPAQALRICERQKDVQNVCQCARLGGLIVSACALDALYGGDAPMAPFTEALHQAQLDGVVLPFSEIYRLPSLLKRLKAKDISQSFLDKIKLHNKAFQGIAPSTPPRVISALSARETQVLRLTATGKTRKETAAALAIQEDTVKKHLSAIYKKLGAKNRTEAIALARTHGML